MRILNIDIETSPAVAYLWDLRTRYVPASHLIEPKRVLCFAAKWLDEPHVYFYSRWHEGQEKTVRRAWELLDLADAVITYNGTRFDEPMLNTEFATFGMLPPSPAKRIDLYQTVTKRFGFMSNSLDYVSRHLGTSGKVSHEGFSLWSKTLAGDAEARKTMRQYNIADVHANESLYRHLLPWIQGHPSHAAHVGEDVCPACGGCHLQRRGYYRTQVCTYQRYVCTDCGKWSRGGKRIGHVDIREVAA